ncbi:CarboxypepD_reg-like domain-containing protein [Nonlabens sp. Hel1_33_55]|uniref:carboxypeptidase-like regulatory domain-containing protein n=1 Tax=Nonlabens sp. Hel1_33_55 TaxID=1336802 RepID=UPI000875B765|nr:carboxypeptidase-like regulatory domain-containing protein [Nonlabens sp. Hel1_33_55]SCY40513.1 CarboxypepD_reg-like domain-containing protein [Nonlabens sp. Hel1_33_55]
MKYLFLFLLISSAVVAQDRIQLEGTILGVTKEPLEGITIFNGSTLEGTVTNEDGNFYIDVRAGDKLSFSAVQYDPFTVTVTAATVEKGTTLLTFSQGVNLLDEVVVTDESVVVAVKKTEMPETGLDQVSERNIRVAAVDRIENTFSDRIRQPEEIPLENTAFNQSQLRYNSFNLVGLLGGLLINGALSNLDLSVNAPSKQESRFKEVLLQNEYSTEYLVDYLDIPEDKLFEFMVFAQEKGLNKAMLLPENEFQLLQFLDAQATTFKKRLDTNKE